MKRAYSFLVLLSCLLYNLCFSQPTPYLPELFKAFPNVRDLALTPMGNEMYFTVESLKKEFSVIMVSKHINNKWTTPQVVPFSGKYRDLEPALSADGLMLYFASARPTDSSQPKDVDIWFVQRKTINSMWSLPVNAGPYINTKRDEYYPSVATSGNLYFTRLSDSAIRKEDIFVSTKTNDGYTPAVPLSSAINSNYYEYNAFIAPDESFIIFTSYGRSDDMGGSDLYISTNDGGMWKPAVHMGAINSNRIDYCPFVDMTQRLLYFTSERSKVPKVFETAQSTQSLLESFNQPSNGSSRIYVIPFDVPKY